MRNVSICVAGGKAPSIFTALSQGRGSAGPSEGLRLVRMGAKLWLAGTRGWSVGRGSAAWLGGCGQHGASPPGGQGGRWRLGAGGQLPCTGVALCTSAWWDAAPRAEDSLHRGSGVACQGHMSLLKREVAWIFCVALSARHKAACQGE